MHARMDSSACVFCVCLPCTMFESFAFGSSRVSFLNPSLLLHAQINTIDGWVAAIVKCANHRYEAFRQVDLESDESSRAQTLKAKTKKGSQSNTGGGTKRSSSSISSSSSSSVSSSTASTASKAKKQKTKAAVTAVAAAATSSNSKKSAAKGSKSKGKSKSKINSAAKETRKSTAEKAKAGINSSKKPSDVKTTKHTRILARLANLLDKNKSWSKHRQILGILFKNEQTIDSTIKW